ncbi:MAG: Xaa-Pro peptidase family protein, partial [bacterium]
MESVERPDHPGRLQALWARPEMEGLDVVLITEPIHLRYLTGFTGTRGALLAARGESTLFIDARYENQAAEEVAGPEVVVVRGPPWAAAADRITADQRAGFEARRMCAADADRLRRHSSARAWEGVDAGLEALRRTKDGWEVVALREAAGIADAVWEELRERLVPGLTEWGVAGMVEESLRRHGSRGSAFEPIVASGVRGALPHGRASGKVLEEGECVTVDFGAVVEGYHSDIARSWRLGDADPEEQAWFEVLDEALTAAVQALEPGLSGAEVDGVARGIIDEAGYGAYFVHNLGHGIGLEVHEGPRLARGSSDRLEAGMT